MGLLVNPETAKAIEDMLLSEEVEVAFIKFADRSLITIGELITCDGSNVDS